MTTKAESLGYQGTTNVVATFLLVGGRHYNRGNVTGIEFWIPRDDSFICITFLTRSGMKPIKARNATSWDFYDFSGRFEACSTGPSHQLPARSRQRIPLPKSINNHIAAEIVELKLSEYSAFLARQERNQWETRSSTAAQCVKKDQELAHIPEAEVLAIIDNNPEMKF